MVRQSHCRRNWRCSAPTPHPSPDGEGNPCLQCEGLLFKPLLPYNNSMKQPSTFERRLEKYRLFSVSERDWGEDQWTREKVKDYELAGHQAVLFRGKIYVLLFGKHVHGKDPEPTMKDPIAV